jgi:hypothetical protein
MEAIGFKGDLDLEILEIPFHRDFRAVAGGSQRRRRRL